MKVVSTKLSKAEHEALLEMANLLGMNTVEYIRSCIMFGVCSSWDFDINDELEPEYIKLMEKNEKKFQPAQV